MQPEPAESAAQKPQPSEQLPGNPVPKDVNLPELAAVDSHPERNAPAAATTARTSFEPENPSETKKPTQQKDEAPKDQLPQVKTLFSQTVSDDSVAQTALGNTPRGQRMNDLCRTELKQQIEHISPKYRDPEIPSYRPFTNETIIQVMETGRFRTNGNWYSIQYECAVDTDATKILSFAFKFGGLIPRSQYAKYKIRE
ncbi:proline rich protein [Rhizobium sp. CCGE 510]|nr:proline rich protein [Rhizobium sp. CCGE 510]